MGIFYLASKLTDTGLSTAFFILGIHIAMILYFVFVHRFIFRNGTQSQGVAIMASIFGVGLGQAYNRQLKKSIIYFTLFILMTFISKVGKFDSDKFIWVIIIFYIVMLIDAVLGTEKAERELFYQSRMEEIKAKTKVLLDYQAQGKKFGVDTNILMHEPDLLVYLLDNESIDLYMSMTVFNELDGLKKSTNRTTRQNAQMAFDVIEAFQQKGKIQLLQTPKTSDIRKYKLGGTPDEKIIGTYLHESSQEQHNLVFLSNEKGARIIARNVGMPVVEF